jgi:hypothetical protein
LEAIDVSIRTGWQMLRPPARDHHQPENTSMTGAASRAVAGCFALAAFAVAVVAGLAGGNTPSGILVRALIAMIVCYPVGLVIGLVCQRVIEEHVKAPTAANAVGEPGAGASPAEQSAENAEEAEDVMVV